MAKITDIDFHWNYNYVNFSDTDCMTDYFHGYTLGQKETCEWIKENGADIITTRTVNEDTRIPTLRRVKQVCKKAGYEFTDKSHNHTYCTGSQSWVIAYELKKINPSN